MKIPILDLKRQYKSIKNEIDNAIRRVVNEQTFVLGEKVRNFEREIASYCGVKYAIGVNSGTDALILALEAIGIKKGEEVITTPFTFVATAESIVRVGAKPVFVDVDPRTSNIDSALIEKKITKKTKAILPVHIFGLCADMERILNIAKRYGLKVIEDCAQAIGSEYKSRKAGSMGDVSCISFYPGKNLGCFGDGGMVVTEDRKLYAKIKLLRNHGSQAKYIHKIIGYNSRLDNLQASILSVKLKHLDRWIEARIKNAEFFDKELAGYPVSMQHVPIGCRHSFHLYVLYHKKNKDLIMYLNKNGVEARQYYPLPLHLQQCFKFLGRTQGVFPVAERLSKENFAIPVYPELTEEERRYITRKIKQFFS